ncbi:MAG: hypothetical protein E7C82_03590 [Anaerococcus hydrogenalis]|uniref:hypothetical protein n=1 Tax=Anaerococcus hydrogenalis TaxID=33029 RepID=UPI0028FF2A38|nr:hypothetical protein [Anaerococcus hydrogenalis]MDU2582769.1 hypothetical protein [Anaerococcus hydrogenalis]
MKYELLKKEFSHLSSFMIWDDSYIKNAVPNSLDDEKFRDKYLNSDFIYIALNLITDNEDFYKIYKNFSGDIYKDIFDKTNLRPWWVFHNLEKGIFAFSDPAISKLNRSFTSTKLEGTYITDFLKSSTDSDCFDGFVTKSAYETKKILKSLSKENLDKYLKKQLKALDREVYLLGIEKPKFLVMSSVFDIFSYAFNNLLNEKEFPHIFKGEIVDKPTSYGAPLKNNQFDMINIFLRNLDSESYPKFMINYIEKNHKIIEDLIKIGNKAIVIGILYLSLDLSCNLSKECFSYLNKISYRYKDIINKIKLSFSKEMIREIIKNLPFILTKGKSLINKKNLYFYESIFSHKGNILVNIDDSLDLLIDLLKLDNIRDAYFLTGSRIDSFVFLNLFEKSLKFSNRGRVLNKSLDEIKDKKIDKFVSRICKENLKLVDNILSKNNFNTAILIISYKEFIKEDNKDIIRKLVKKFKMYELINFNNKEIYLKLGKKYNEILYKFYDKDFKLFVEKNLSIDLADDFNFLKLKSLKTEKIYKFEEFITFIRRGYSMAELLNIGLKYSNDGISYITNSNISKGFLDDSMIRLDCSKDKLIFAQKNDLIISKSPPYKVVLIEDDEKYLANDNLFIVKIDKNKIEPFYLWAYLQSKKAQNLIFKNYKNKKNLSISLLKNMEINIYDSDKMEIIKESFMNNINNLKKYYRKLDNLNKMNEKLFDQN